MIDMASGFCVWAKQRGRRCRARELQPHTPVIIWPRESAFEVKSKQNYCSKEVGMGFEDEVRGAWVPGYVACPLAAVLLHRSKGLGQRRRCALSSS